MKTLLSFFRLIDATVRVYTSEFLYYYRGKKNPIAVDVLIRKRAHVVERFLFHPDQYDARKKEEIVNELEVLLEENRSFSDKAYYRWAKRILDEYKNGETCGICPNIFYNKVENFSYKIDRGNLLNLMKRRRSRRVFGQEPLTEEEKMIIVDAALHAPSSCNRQTLEFIFIDDREVKKFVASTIPGGKQFFAEAPILLVIVSYGVDYRYPDDRMVPWLDSAAGIQNIYLICETMGIGCCWGSYTSFGSVQNERQVRKLLNIPDQYVITGCLALGKTTQEVCYIPRAKPSERYHKNRMP